MGSEKQKYLYGVLAALTTTTAWGVEPVFLNLALAQFSTSFVSWFRFAFVIVVLALLFARRSPDFLTLLRKPPALAYLAALVLAGNYFGFVKGIELSGPAVATLLLQTGPLFLALFGFTLFREKMSPVQFIGIALSFLGYFVFYADRRSFYDPNTIIAAGDLIVIGAGLCWGSYAALQKVLSRQYNPQHLNVLILGMASLLLIPGLFSVSIADFSFPGLVYLLCSGCCNLAAYWGLAEALRNAPAAIVSIIIVVNPFITLSLSKIVELNGWSWMPREPVGWLGYFGAALAVLGLFMAARRPRKWADKSRM